MILTSQLIKAEFQKLIINKNVLALIQKILIALITSIFWINIIT